MSEIAGARIPIGIGFNVFGWPSRVFLRVLPGVNQGSTVIKGQATANQPRGPAGNLVRFIVFKE
jgi:hypothetical protein